MDATPLSQLADGLPVTIVRGDGATAVRRVREDSRAIEIGDLFVARRGRVADGRRFIVDAIDRGAVAVLTGAPDDVPQGQAVLVPTGGAAALPAVAARLAERAAGSPSQALELVGITGTNGKTTTAWLLRHVLRTAGHRCGLVGTVEIDDGLTAAPATLTTPPADVLSEALARMVAHGCTAAVLEVSSHALEQDRVTGLRFAAAIFTNLSGDHLDEHGTMEAYAAAKARLFAQLDGGAAAIVNADDAAAATMIAASGAPILRTSLADDGADARAIAHHTTLAGCAATWRGPWGAFDATLPLIGRHNLSNALQAAVAAWRLGVDAATVAEALRTAPAPPGRLEPVTAPGDPAQVLVDYAHTDDALDNALGAVRPLVPAGGRLRVVFGCGGDRDRTKRPRMAAAAWRWADEVIVTSDNPRSEAPESIIDEILAGVPAPRRAATRREADRAAAIALAVETARPGDVIVIAGKGHEDYQVVGAERRDFDDRRVARAALTARAARAEAVVS